MKSIQSHIDEFEKQFRFVYEGILHEEVLKEGNTWFTEFLRSALSSQKREIDGEWMLALMHLPKEHRENVLQTKEVLASLKEE